MVSVHQKCPSTGFLAVLLLLGILGCAPRIPAGPTTPITAAGASPACDEAFTTALDEAISSEQRDDVVIRYSWSEGFGIGDVEAVLRSSGDSTLRLMPEGGETREITTRIRWKRYLRLLRLAQAARFGCLQPVKRDRCILDLGVYRLSIQVGLPSRAIFDDGEHYVPTNPALDELYAEIYALKNLFGERFDWGPFGTVTFPCELLKEQRDG